MNQVKYYDSTIHESQLRNWIEQWKMDPNVVEYLPTTGFIIEGVCAIFLYLTNSPICYIEGFISNKQVSDSKRDQCLDAVVAQAINFASDKGFKRMLAITQLPAVSNRAEKLGFHMQGKQNLLMRIL